MSFKELIIERKYRSSEHVNLGEEFIAKVLPHSVSYKRAVGFFSSSSLVYTSRGLLKIASHYKPGLEPVIKFIVSPRLSHEDVEAIRTGYKTKEAVIEGAMLREFNPAKNDIESERLNILSHLISSGAMDIKVAVTEFSEDDIGMYHEKIGIMVDENGDSIGFSGSLNESENAFINNFESIRVYKSWDASTCLDLSDLSDDFDNLWNNQTKRVAVYSFPKAVEKKIFEYRRATYNEKIDDYEAMEKLRDKIFKMTLPSIDKTKLPTFPYDYQKEAIQNWFNNKCRGIFEMATGTGKTFTGYGAMVKLLEKAEYRLFTVIICPYQHLVEQWVEDASLFNIKNMIIGYSNSKYSNYLSLLKQAVQDFNDGINGYVYFITTNASFKTPGVQSALKELKGRALLVADEAHNLGSLNFGPCLLENFKYRLALSATFDRYRDESGTNQIYAYFGKKCIEYPLEKAIDENKLTKYYYHPIVTYLSKEEREEYIRLTKEISKRMVWSKSGEKVLSKNAEFYAIKRARLIAGSFGKTAAFKQEIKKHIDEKYMLVYCGTSKINDSINEEIDQIDLITDYLGNELKMSIERYTSRESVNERIDIKNRFKRGDLQALVAIKCLDEGVNIPNIKTAFILASSTNPREYVQRRGRVLRLAPGKDFAVIYDFVCLPMPFEELGGYDASEIDDFNALVRNEINRIKEFGDHAINIAESDSLVEKIKEEYGLYDFAADELSEFEWNEEE